MIYNYFVPYSNDFFKNMIVLILHLLYSTIGDGHWSSPSNGENNMYGI